MIRFIYNLVWPIGLLVFLPGYLVKMFRRGGYRKNFGQRFALYREEVVQKLRGSSTGGSASPKTMLKPKPQGGSDLSTARFGVASSAERPIWLHAVSVGEVGIALKLARKLHELLPQQQLALTTTTTTGFAVAEANASPWLTVLYSPLDFWPIMRRAFAAIQPRLFVLVEAEMWPNMMAFAHARSVPVALVNARLSTRSEGRMRRAHWAVKSMLQQLDLVTVQNHNDAERWSALGIERERIRTVGSVKFDPEETDIHDAMPRDVLRLGKIDNDRPILVAGSTHPGEEEILADIFVRLRREFPKLLLVVVPRHVERANEVERMLQRKELRVARRSAIEKVSAPDGLLIDSTGELRHWYAVATVVFIGKTLLAHGGQNPAEAIVAGKPVLFGPHMENFRDLAQALVERGGAFQASTPDELEKAMADLLRQPLRCEEMVSRAHEVLALHRGATARTAQLVIELIGSRQ